MMQPYGCQLTYDNDIDLMTKNKSHRKQNKPSHIPHEKHAPNGWLLFMIFGIALGVTAAFISNTNSVVYYVAGAVVGGLIGFLIGQSLDRMARKKNL